MIEKTIYDYLTAQLPTVPIFTQYPENPPGLFVAIDRTGGSGAAYISRATVTVQSYAGSLYEAAALNEAVKEKMLVINRHDKTVFHVELNADYDYTDTAKKRYRYQAVYDITYQE